MSYKLFINTFPQFDFLHKLFDEGRIRYKVWQNGEFICNKDDNLENIIFFTSGRGKVSRHLHNGKEIMYKSYNSGEIAGDVEFILQSQTSCSLISIDNLSGFMVPVQLLTKDLYTKMFNMLSQIVARKFIESSTQQAIRLGYTLEERLAYYLIFDYKGEKLSMSELAAQLSSTYRHLSRVFNKLSTKEIIKVNNKVIEILNQQMLKKLCNEVQNDIIINSQMY